MRTSIVGFALAALGLSYAAPASAQWLVTDARRIGMGGLTLGRSGDVVRYNPAYRAVSPQADRRGQPKVTIPIPLGIIQFLHDHPHITNDPEFKPGSTGFNPVLFVNTILNLPLFLEVKKAPTPNTILNLPLFLEVKKAPTPTNDVAFTIGKNQLVVNLGAAAQLVPEDQFGISSSSRPLDPGIDIKGVRLGVMGWLHTQAEFQLGDTLLGFLRDSVPARDSTTYKVLVHGLVEGGFAPTVSYAGRIAGDSASGFYVGGALHYYFGVGYMRTDGDAGFLTGDTIFGGPTPVTPRAQTLTQYSKPGNTLGHGVGGDVGVAWISGPIELGVGVNDIGATITWPDTRRDSAFYHDSSYSTPVLPGHVETKTKLPVSYIANLAYTVGKTTLGADVLNTGRGAVVHVGAEQRISVWAVRGGIARDQRKRIVFGWGGGLRFGGLGLDVGFWTHTNSLSNERAITMATSLSIY